MRAPLNERKYQFIKLVNSGRSLKEIKSLAKAVDTAFGSEYVNAGSLSNLARLEGGLHTLTRNKAINLKTFRFKQRSVAGLTRDELIARWVTGIQPLEGKMDWTRDGNLIRRGKKNKPRPGSSKGKVRKTSIKGEKKVLRDFGALIRTLSQLQSQHGKNNHNALRKAFNLKRTISGKLP